MAFRGGAGLPLAGGGGARLSSGRYVHSAVVLLNNAQIKSLPGTPVLLIPAPGANMMVIPTFTCIFTYGFSPLAHPNAYTGMSTDGYLALRTTSPFADVQDLTVNDSSISLTYFSDLMTLDPAVSVATAPLTQGFYPGWGVIPFVGEYEAVFLNKAVYISCNNNGNTADLGGGNADNTMSVSVLYVKLNVRTGQFQ